jgi:alpha-L-fucosidase 2
MEAVHEMLLQSWSALPGQRDTEVVRIFPSMPWRWHEASFQDLRAEGGWLVSARRENNATTWLKIGATRDGLLRIRDNFGGRQPTWSRPDIRKTGENFEVRLKAGQSIEAELPKAEAIPPAPANAAAPVEIKER